MSVRGRNWPSLVTRHAAVDEYTLELVVPAPLHQVRIPPPTSLGVRTTDDRWPAYCFQLLLVASEYCAALAEFMAWSFPSEWEPLKAIVAEHARCFISTSTAVPPAPPSPPPPQPSLSTAGDDPGRPYQLALQAFCVWAAFTHAYFHGTRDLTSDGPPERWLRRLVGDRGWHPEGPVFDAANRWVQRTLPRLRQLFGNRVDALPPPRAKYWPAAAAAAAGGGAGGGGRELATRGDAAVRDEGPYVPVYPYRVTGGFQGNRIKFTLKGQQAPRSLRGSCGVPAAFGQTNNCALGYLVLADVIQAFYQASEKWRQPARELEQQVIRSFFDNVLSSDDAPLCGAAGAGHLQYGYPAAIASCALGWEVALEQVQRWVVAAEGLAAFAAGEGPAATAAAAAAGAGVAVRSWLLLPRALQQPGPESLRLASLQQQLQRTHPSVALPVAPPPPVAAPPSPLRQQPRQARQQQHAQQQQQGQQRSQQAPPPGVLPQPPFQQLPVQQPHLHTSGAAMSPFVLLQLQRSAAAAAAGGGGGVAAAAAAAQPGPPPPPPQAWPQQPWAQPAEQRAEPFPPPTSPLPDPAGAASLPAAFRPHGGQYGPGYQTHHAFPAPSHLPPPVPPPPPPPPPPPLPPLPAPAQALGEPDARAVEGVAGSINAMSLDSLGLQFGDQTLALLGQELPSLAAGAGIPPAAPPPGAQAPLHVQGGEAMAATGLASPARAAVAAPEPHGGLSHSPLLRVSPPPSPPPAAQPLGRPQFPTAPAVGAVPLAEPSRTVTTEVPWPLPSVSSPPPLPSPPPFPSPPRAPVAAPPGAAHAPAAAGAALADTAAATVGRVAGLLRAAQAAVEQVAAAGPSLQARFAPLLRQHEPALRAFCEQLQQAAAAAAAGSAALTPLAPAPARQVSTHTGDWLVGALPDQQPVPQPGWPQPQPQCGAFPVSVKAEREPVAAVAGVPAGPGALAAAGPESGGGGGGGGGAGNAKMGFGGEEGGQGHDVDGDGGGGGGYMWLLAEALGPVPGDTSQGGGSGGGGDMSYSFGGGSSLLAGLILPQGSAEGIQGSGLPGLGYGGGGGGHRAQG